MKQQFEKKSWILILAVSLLLGLTACGAKEPAQTEPPAITTAVTEQVETTQPTAAPATEPQLQVETIPCINGEIETPWLILQYPDALADHLVVAKLPGEPYTLEFYALLEGKPEQRLFDICLGGSGNLGTVETASGEVAVGLTLYPFEPDESWTQGEVDTILAMQDGANYLTENLPLVREPEASQAPVVSDVIPESNVVNFMSFRTPYCTLYYPVVWQDQVRVDQVEKETCTVRFYGRVAGRGEKLLVSVIFGGDEGEQLGVVATDRDEMVTVNILLEELLLPGWSEEDIAQICAMQEDVNQLIAQLPLQ